MFVFFRSHQEFLSDTTTAHVINFGLHHFGMTRTSDGPKINKPPVLMHLLPLEERTLWLQQQASIIVDTILEDETHNIQEAVASLDSLESLKQSGVYVCRCNKQYKRRGNFLNHIKDTGHIDVPEGHDSVTESDEKYAQAKTLTKLGLIHCNLDDAYKYGDGERVFRLLKYFMLYFHQCGNTKYALWIWRMTAFSRAVLSKRHAYEYVWNTSINMRGGLGNCIPNDNLVEIHVRIIKDMLKRQGGNVTFKTAKEAALLVQVYKELGDNFDHSAKGYSNTATAAKVDKSSEILEISDIILKGKACEYVQGRKCEGFQGFKDPIQKTNLEKLFTWMKDHKKKLQRDFKDLYKA